jgi:membrane associated rhomboid family serine protease
MFPVLRDGLSRTRRVPFQRAFAGASLVSRLRCPGCRHVMLATDAGGIAIDVCRRCQLVWFDRGEAPEPDAQLPRPPLPRKGWEMPDDRQIEELWHLLQMDRGLPVELESPVPAYPFGNIPLATAALTLGMIAVGLFADATWIARYAFLPAEPFRDAGITLVTHFFLHGGVWHLAGNAYFLVVFGDNVEEAAGRAGLLLLAFLGAAAGALLHALSEPFRPLPLVGASAGISALLAYYALRFPSARIGWYFMNLPAWGFAALWAVYQVLFAQWFADPGVTEVSAAAHVGGAAVGVAFFATQRRMSPWTSREGPPS